MSKALTTLNPIEGSLEARVQAYSQMGSAIANAKLVPGYDTPGKVIAACWLAEALGVHPTQFMHGVYAMEMGGKVVLQPRWEFEHALLMSRLPGYRMREMESSETRAVLAFSATGIPEIIVTYTMDDATRQGLRSKNKNYETSPKEMLFKQAFHRGAKRVGPHVLLGLPTAMGAAEEVEHEPSGAEVVDEAEEQREYEREVAAAAAVPPPPTMTQEYPADEAPPGPDWRTLCSDALTRVYGLKEGDRLGRIAKANEVMAELLGSSPGWKRASEIGLLDHKAMYEHLEKKRSAGAATEAVATEAAPGKDAAPAPAPPVEADPPPPAVDDTRPPLEMTRPDEEEGSWEGVCGAAAYIPTKTIIQEGQNPKTHRPNGDWWLVSKTVFDKLGYRSPVQLMTADGAAAGMTPHTYKRIANAIVESYQDDPAWKGPQPAQPERTAGRAS